MPISSMPVRLPGSNPGWTPERIEALTCLWNDGLPANQIAAKLGQVTRNAVIGKVHRLGLPGRKTTSRSPRRTSPRRTAPAAFRCARRRRSCGLIQPRRTICRPHRRSCSPLPSSRPQRAIGRLAIRTRRASASAVREQPPDGSPIAPRISASATIGGLEDERARSGPRRNPSSHLRPRLGRGVRRRHRPSRPVPPLARTARSDAASPHI